MAKKKFFTFIFLIYLSVCSSAKLKSAVSISLIFDGFFFLLLEIKTANKVPKQSNTNEKVTVDIPEEVQIKEQNLPEQNEQLPVEIEEKEFLKDYEKLEKMQILHKREDKISFDEASYALLIYFVKKEERTLDYIKEVIGI